MVLLALLVGSSAGATWLAPSPLDATPEAELLDIGIQPFDPGLERKWSWAQQQERVKPEVRKSEAAFLAIHLMQTLQGTERFGLVRMVPANSRTADLMISGKIRYSTGRKLELTIEAEDATGRRWFKRKYKQSAEAISYAIRFMGTSEPFQQLYDQIAIDLIQQQKRFKKEYLEELREITELRYAAQLAPNIFDDYLTVDRKERTRVERLPSREDPILERVRQIQLHNEFFLDLLTERYLSFYGEMDETYDEYRANSYDVETALMEAIRHYNANARPRMNERGDFGSFDMWKARRAAYFRRRAAAQARYLEDISLNFSSVVEPMLIELDGETLQLEGSIEDQYAQWQELLEKIFESETGFSPASRPTPATVNTTKRR
jgi:hypothetical protein